MAALAAGTSAQAQAKQDVAARLAGRVPPEVVALVQQLAADAAGRGLPIDPLVQKAIEGGAKGVPADRVATAVRGVAAQLGDAAAALRDGGLTPADTESIAAGAFALNAGLGARDIAALARAAGRSHRPAVALRVAGTLSALGVPSAETVALVSETMRAGRSAADLVALPARVQAEVARGATPAQAAAGLTRGAGAVSPARVTAPGQTKSKPPHPTPSNP